MHNIYIYLFIYIHKRACWSRAGYMYPWQRTTSSAPFIAQSRQTCTKQRVAFGVKKSIGHTHTGLPRKQKQRVGFGETDIINEARLHLQNQLGRVSPSSAPFIAQSHQTCKKQRVTSGEAGLINSRVQV